MHPSGMLNTNRIELRMRLCSVFLLVLLPGLLLSQNEQQLVLKARDYLKRYQFGKAEELYKSLLDKKPGSAEYNARYGYCIAMRARTLKSKSKVTELGKSAMEYGSASIGLDASYKEGHFTKLLGLCTINENASNKERTKYASQIKNDAERVLRMDPNHGGALHVLGRWHWEMAGFSKIQRTLIKSMYRDFPDGGTYDEAISYFIRAIKVEPDYVEHYLYLAKSYLKAKNEPMARAILKRGLSRKGTGLYYERWIASCKKMLKQLD